MISSQQVIEYRHGFEFDGIMFCWKKKELYRMPYLKGNRSYQKRKLIKKEIGNGYGYSICNIPKSMSNLKEITKRIEYKETVFVDSGMPF
jgi:hypothetical protein